MRSWTAMPRPAAAVVFDGTSVNLLEYAQRLIDESSPTLGTGGYPAVPPMITPSRWRIFNRLLGTTVLVRLTWWGILYSKLRA
eukprot:Skav220161  [mRNA]  locus=scaffold564:225350:226330:- [translate_table: standard]